MPYFGAALSCLPRTELVLTLTSGMTQAVNRDSQLRPVKAPPEWRSFHFLMVWHPHSQGPSACDYRSRSAPSWLRKSNDNCA